MANFLYSLIIYPLELLIEMTFAFCNRVFENYGIDVIFVSVAVTLCCLPLYIIAERWQDTERNIQAKMKSGIDRIKTCFKGDEQYMILTTFYRQNHYHPMMALRSSFSLLIQIPFFIAAYHFLSNFADLRGVPFLFIKDMGSPDALFSIGSFSVNVLPIAMTLINCISGTIYSKGHPIREKVQIYGMAAIFLVVLYGSPAGLVLYWTMNNIFSLVKNVFYKMKNPLKVLYICLCVFIVLADIWLIFLGNGMMKKRLILAAAITALSLIPWAIRFINYLLATWAKPLVENDSLRTKIFLVSAVALALFCGFVIPSELVSSSVQEFSDIDNIASPFFFLRCSLFQSIGFFIVWPVCIYFLFGKRIKTILTLLFSVVLVCGVVNTYAFPGSYGDLNSSLMFLNDLHNESALYSLGNLFLVLAIVFIIVLMFRFLPSAGTAISGGLCLTFAVISFVNISKISKDYKKYREMADAGEKVEKIEPVLHLSKTGKNVVCVMVDSADSDYVEKIFTEKPELYEMFDGFTFHPNTISFNGHTLISSHSLFGGYEYTPYEINKRADKPLVETQSEALLMLARVFSEDLGYTAFLSDVPWANMSHIPDMRITNDYPKITGMNLMRKYVDIWKSEHQGLYDASPVIAQNIKRNFLFFSAFRILPAFTREFLYDNGRWLGTKSIREANLTLTSYSAMEYFRNLTDFDNSESSFAFIVNDLPHESDILPAPEYKYNQYAEIDKDADYVKMGGYSVNVATYLFFGEWLNYLKENGVYDNTRIILVSDHGNRGKASIYKRPGSGNYYSDTHLNPILFTKDFGERGRLKTDMEFMTLADVPSLALEGLVENPKNPFTGNPINMEMKKDGAFVTTSNSHQPVHQYKNKFRISDDEWFIVKDNIFEDSNWKKLEK